MNIYEKLLAIQTELKAPKSQYNSFGKYNYRNCEDILEAVKPICKKHNAVLLLSDKIVFVETRHYIEATAMLVDCEKPDSVITVTAYAREEESKKGMDGSQVTGASSSYARKYALNGLFNIDDTKDSDTTNHGENANKSVTAQNKEQPNNKPVMTKAQKLQILIKNTNVEPADITSYINENFGGGLKVNDLNDKQFNQLYTAIQRFIQGE